MFLAGYYDSEIKLNNGADFLNRIKGCDGTFAIHALERALRELSEIPS